MTRADDIENIVTAAHTLTRLAAARTDNHAPATQWRALSILSREGAMRLGELATASRATQPGMTRLVGQMADQGLVLRQSDPADSRVTLVSATDAGASALAAWRVQLRDALEPFFVDLDDEDWAALSRTSAILSSRTSPVAVAR